MLYLGVSALLGTGFMGFKAYEYNQDYRRPGPLDVNFGTRRLHGRQQPAADPGEWEDEGVAPQRVRLFMTFYFALTGVHGLHLIIGIAVICYLWVRAYLGTLTPDRYVAVEVTSLYWHLVDAIWLFLMPLLYLAGPHHSLHF